MITSQPPSTAGATTQKPTRSVIGLLTPLEAAEFLKVSLSWLAKARMRGDGPPYIEIGRSIRYRMEDLIPWLKGRTRLRTRE